MSLSNPTREEREWMDACKRLGCTVCILTGLGNTPADFHHMLKNGKRISHLHGFGLCPTHHDSGLNSGLHVSRHPWRIKFERRYGTEQSLLEKTRELLGVTA